MVCGGGLLTSVFCVYQRRLQDIGQRILSQYLTLVFRPYLLSCPGRSPPLPRNPHAFYMDSAFPACISTWISPFIQVTIWLDDLRVEAIVTNPKPLVNPLS